MSAPFKVCPRCQQQACLADERCQRCGHQYRTVFAPAPLPIDQTQAVYPPPPILQSRAIDLTVPMDARPLPHIYAPPASLPPGPIVSRPYSGLSDPLGPLRNPYGQPYTQPPIPFDQPENNTVPIVVMWVCVAFEFTARFIFPGVGAGAIAMLAWVAALGLAVYLVTREDKAARVNGWVVIGIKIATVVLVIVLFIVAISIVSKALSSSRPSAVGPPTLQGIGTGSTPMQPWPNVSR